MSRVSINSRFEEQSEEYIFLKDDTAFLIRNGRVLKHKAGNTYRDFGRYAGKIYTSNMDKAHLGGEFYAVEERDIMRFMMDQEGSIDERVLIETDKGHYLVSKKIQNHTLPVEETPIFN